MTESRATVVTISSLVAAGPVGNSVIVPALLALGAEPVAIPTVILSNHPGHGRPEGLEVPAETMAAMLARTVELGFTRRPSLVLTGYFASAAARGSSFGIVASGFASSAWNTASALAKVPSS